MAAGSQLGDAATAALQASLAAEHAAVYGYGVAAARVTGAERARAAAAYAVHLARRDRLAALIRDGGAEPVAAEAGYQLPEPVTSQAAARRLATLVEEAAATAYADLVGAGDAELRELGARALADAAVRAAGWRAAGVAFPGLPERG